MARNYFKIIIRNFWKNRTYSFINVFGLAMGIASALVIVMYVRDELVYDRSFSKSDRIYQVTLDAKMGETESLTSNTPPPVGSTMLQEFPEIEAFTRVFRPYEVVVNNLAKNTQFIEKEVLAVDSNFLQIFDYKMLAGNPRTCFSDPDAAVITEDMARKYFASEPAIGKILLFNGNPVKITGVLAELPAQTSIQFKILKPMKSLRVTEAFSWSWVWLQMDTYVLLKKNITPEQVASLNTRFPGMVSRHAVEAFERIGQPFEAFLKKGGRWNFSIRPMKDVHLYSRGYESRIDNLGDIQQVRIFMVIAVFVIILACINFMNLTTARSVKRAKEVGIQKALGANRSRIILQFFTESYLYTLLATLVALLFISLFIPYFNQISGKSLVFENVFELNNLLLLAGIIVFVGLLSGSYPAFYLTSFNPVNTLKANYIKTSFSSRLVRNGLVVFQFTVSIALIICSTVVFNQLQFTRNKDMGFVNENVLILPNIFDMPGKETFRQEISKEPEVVNASISTDIPAGSAFGDFYVPEPENDTRPVAKDLTLYSYMVDEHFIPTTQVRIRLGRNFSDTGTNDSASVILNETAVKAIGWQNPLGQYLRYPGGDNTRFKVIGVVKDFDAQSVREAITPFALFHKSSKMNETPKNYLLVKSTAGGEAKLLAKAEAKWKKFMPEVPFSYSFLDKNFEALYRSEEKTAKVLGIFTFLSIAVACLGLFGLIAFSVEQRTKEIGIRKVLGASVFGITSLISRDFVKLVFIALLTASPIAWYFMNEWLNNFKYKITIEWWIFVMAGTGAIVIALVTIGYQAVKAAMMNPVDSFKSE